MIENWRRGALEKLGLGYEALREANPGLIYCAITGFGPGPDEDRPGYDFLVQARGGVMGITGQPGGEPTKVGVAISHVALFARTRSWPLASASVRGRARASKLRSRSTLGGSQPRSGDLRRRDTGLIANAHPSIVPTRPLRAYDKPIVVAVGNKGSSQICAIIGRPIGRRRALATLPTAWPTERT